MITDEQVKAAKEAFNAYPNITVEELPNAWRAALEAAEMSSTARIAALEAALEAKDISIKTLSMLLRTNLLLRHPDRTYEEVDADIRKIVEGTNV